MKNFYKKILSGALVFSMMLGFLMAVHVSIAHNLAYAVTPKAQKAAFDKSCRKDFFGLVPWYEYLPAENFNYNYYEVGRGTTKVADPCSIKCFNFFSQKQVNYCGQRKSDLPPVVTALIDTLLRIAAIVALAFIIVSAFQYTRSEGKPDDTAKAQSALVNALIGLGIAMVAVAFVRFVGNQLKG